MNLLKNKYVALAIVPLFLFLLFLPAGLFINFYQNDDWCYYMTVQNFLDGNLTLHPYIAPTFYMQGFLGAAFATFFGIVHLPVLTLLMACVSLYIFILILHDILNVQLKWANVLGLLFFLNPLGVYELWGFMTNHYFNLFLLLGIYFFLLYEKTSKSKFNFLYMLFVFFGLLARQISMVMPLAAAIYFLFSKKIKLAVFNFLFFGFLYIFYSKILPLTPRMLELPLQYQHFLQFEYAYALIYGSLLVLTAYLLPLILNTFDLNLIVKNKTRLLLMLLIAGAGFVILNRYFKPDTVSWGEFPYFENVVERTGFYPRGIHGTKYYFAGNFDLWKYWDIAAKTVFILFSAYFIVFIPKRPNFFIFYIVVYMGIMVASETYFDRYIFTIVPIGIMYFASLNPGFKNYTKLFLVVFVGFLAYLGYLFSADFLLVNKYVWNRSVKLVEERNIDPHMIQGTNAWKLTYRNHLRNYKYNFSYDNNKINPKYARDYILVEEKEIKYPLNIFINPKIYLYEKKDL